MNPNLEGSVFANRYKLESFIGEGGMSLVYRAVDVRTGHNVAIKILKSEFNSDKEFLERFQREAQAASLMSHHNLVNLLDVGVEGEWRYLVLEYVSGSTLKDIICQKGKLDYRLAIQITVRILSALQHAHDNGIIHRDIKPQNVLIHKDGHVKVSDFGIARMTSGVTIGKGDTVLGSVHYSSPEQASGNVANATSDLYSTGVVLYEMLTGRVPFYGDTPVAVAMQHIRAVPPPITDFAPETPAAVVAVVMKALEKNPKNRYQSAREMADALLSAKDGNAEPKDSSVKAPSEENTSAKKEEVPQKQNGKRKKKAKWFLPVALSACFLLLIGIGTAFVVKYVTKSATVPDVVGLTSTDATAEIRRNSLNVQVQEINHDTVASGFIIEQYPDAETRLEKGDTVIITVSLGPVISSMPNVVGLSKTDAASRLKEYSLGNIVVVKVVSSSAVDTVLSQSPAAQETYVNGQDVELTVSGGSTVVPDLSLIKKDEVAVKLSESNLRLGECVEVETTDPSQIGVVLNQTPSAGTMVVLDASVSVSVGVESKPHHANLVFSVPQSEKSRILRVLLVTNENQEELQYECVLAANSTDDVTLQLSATSAGPHVCRIFIDGDLYREMELIFE